eukprot:11159266-Alexandrium_andersonii.AAC.1
MQCCALYVPTILGRRHCYKSQDLLAQREAHETAGRAGQCHGDVAQDFHVQRCACASTFPRRATRASPRALRTLRIPADCKAPA